MEPFRDCFPEGVVNLIFGNRQLIKPILESGAINVLAFIGSSEAANAMRLSHPSPNRLRCILGLGAKNAAVIMESADLDLAVSEAVSGSLSLQRPAVHGAQDSVRSREPGGGIYPPVQTRASNPCPSACRGTRACASPPCPSRERSVT